MITLKGNDTVKHRPKVALLGKIPPDILNAISNWAELIDAASLRAMPEGQRKIITHGLTSALSGVNTEMLPGLPSLITIVSVGAGMDRFDLPELSAQGITLSPTLEVMTEDTAEFAVGLIFSLLRNIVANDRFIRDGNWAKGRAPLGRRLSMRKIGIVGLGRIGSRIAGKLTALGCDVSYNGPTRKDVAWRYESKLTNLARNVDVLVLSCAGGAATRALIGEKIIGLLGPDGCVVNVSRGSVVDEPALLDALERKSIAGAALDVFESEPHLNPRFFQLSNCILQPHASVFTHENRRDLVIEVKHLLGV